VTGDGVSTGSVDCPDVGRTARIGQDGAAALTQRPGRIDLAVEIPGRTTSAGEHCSSCMQAGATVTADLDPAVAATEGATASAMKELMRRAVLRTLERDADAGLIEPPVDR
jgi:hypothetical protein